MEKKYYKEVIEVTKEENEELQEILNITEGAAEDYGRDEVIQTFSAVFETEYGKFGVDIKVCNGDTPYVDPVLFMIVEDKEVNHWYELYPLDVEDTLLGEYIFEYEVNDEVCLVLQVDIVLKE